MTISIFPNGQWRLPGHPMTPITKETAVTTEFSAKTALITGAGRGIGRAAALGLADAGASVILLARSDTQLAETRALLLARGAAAGQIRILAADLGDEDQRNRAAGAALAAGRIDILINNAATVEPIGATAAIPAAELRRAFAPPPPPPPSLPLPPIHSLPYPPPPLSCAAPESPSTPTGPAGWTPPCRPGSASRTLNASEPPCTSGSTAATPTAP